MNSATEVPVIILSVFLSIFLALGIALTIYLIKLTHDIRAVTRSAGKTVDSIESAVSGVVRLASPMFVADLINRYMKKFNKKKKGDE